MYLLTCVFCYFFLFSPIPEYFFFFPWSGISLPTDCTVLLLPVVAWNKKPKPNIHIPLSKQNQTKPKKNQNQTKPCSSETNLPFNINHLENFIIHQPISPFPGILPFLVVDDLCNLALPFDSLPLPCPSAALLCCSLKRVTPQCLFILFGMLSFTLFITLFFHLFEIYFLFYFILFWYFRNVQFAVCLFFFCCLFWMHNFTLFSLLFNLVCLYFTFSYAWFIALHVFFFIRVLNCDSMLNCSVFWQLDFGFFFSFFFLLKPSIFSLMYCSIIILLYKNFP